MNALSYTSASVFPQKILDPRIVKNLMLREVVPVHVQFNPTNKCNLKCSFCSCRDKDNTEITLSRAIDIFERFHFLGARAVTLSGGGEPLCHPEINEIIDAALITGLKVGLVTNGVLLPRLNPRLKITWCRISLSGDHMITDSIVSHIRKMPQVDWAISYVLTPHNYTNISSAVMIANELNMTHVRIVDDIHSLEESKIGHAREIINRHNIDDSRVIYQGRKDYTPGSERCLISLLKPVVDVDGHVYPCCIEKNESVLIEKNGIIYPKIIDRVEIGDYAYGNGTVKGVHRKYGQSGLRVILKNGRQLTSSYDHLWIRGQNLEEVRADELNIGDLIPCRYDIKSEPILFEEESKLIIAGYYMAEGWISETCIGFAFGHQDLHKAKYVMSHLPGCKMYKRRTTYQVMCYDANWRDYLSQFGNRSTEKMIAPLVFGLSDKHKNIFIESYCSCDGQITKPRKGYDNYKLNFSTVSKKLASDLVYLFSTMGVVAVVKMQKRDQMVIEGRTVNCHNIYRIGVGGAYNLKKIDFLKDKITEKKRSPRRAKGKIYNEHTMYSPVISIEEVHDIDTVDIEVEGTNRFYSTFGILLHNCGAQYAIPGEPRAYTARFDMGCDYESIWGNQVPFDGSACNVCYYKAYNDMLILMWDYKDIKHGCFV